MTTCFRFFLRTGETSEWETVSIVFVFAFPRKLSGDIEGDGVGSPYAENDFKSAVNKT